MGTALEYSPISLTGQQTTAGVAEETINLSENGAAAVATISVPSQNRLVLSDLVFGAEGAARFRIQKTVDGTNFFDIFLWRQASDSSSGVSPLKEPIIISGGANVAIRVRAQTPNVAALVTFSPVAYRQTEF